MLRPVLYFDENKPRYRHGCCHIQTAALVIGALQLICYLYELTDLTFLYHQRFRVSGTAAKSWNVGGDGDDFTSRNDTSLVTQFAKTNVALTNSNSLENEVGVAGGLYVRNLTPLDSKQPWARAADAAWNGLVAFSIILMFYATKWVKPYLMTPKLVFDAIAAGILTVGTTTMLILSAGLPASNLSSRSFLPLSLALCSTIISCYIFFVTLRCFKYLLEKRAFLNGIYNRNVFVLPFTEHSGRMTTTEAWNHDLPAYGSLYTDVPPAYPGVDPKNSTAPLTSTTTVGGTTDNAADQLTRTVVDKQHQQPSGSDDTGSQEKGLDHLPTYDEAQKLNGAPNTKPSN